MKRTKNTERRIQRQLVLEDGRVLEKEAPHVVVDTIEDIETHETDHVEDRDVLDDLQKVMSKSYGKLAAAGNNQADHNQVTDASARSSVSTSKSSSSASKRQKSGKREQKQQQQQPLLPVGNVVSDTFQRTVNTHDVQGSITHISQFMISNYQTKRLYG